MDAPCAAVQVHLLTRLDPCEEILQSDCRPGGEGCFGFVPWKLLV